VALRRSPLHAGYQQNSRQLDPSVAALRLRLATALLYGDSPQQQEAALAAPDPTTLPWIAAALTQLSHTLTDLASGMVPVPYQIVSHPVPARS
jgi:hypothetical protein